MFTPGINTDPGGARPEWYNDPVGFLTSSGAPQYDNTSTALASLSRAQWSQAASMMYPLQNQLINFAENPLYAGQQADKAGLDTGQAFDTLNTNMQQQQSYQGLAPTPAQQAAQSKTMALDKSMAVAGSENQARQAAARNQQGVLTGFSNG